jgi:DNA-binding IclR family transcriptional regulator
LVCYTCRVARHIQSIERAVAVLRVLGSAPHPLTLQEVSDSLDLAKGTAHGILATLRHVGLVDQDRRTGHYQVTATPDWLHGGGIDPNELRSRAMNWADRLAATTGEAVLIGVPGEGDVEVVHHVFCPDGSPQRMMYGDRLPAHATALGKVLLAFTRWWELRLRQLPLQRWTGLTITDRDALAQHVDDVRRRGYAVEVAELHPERAGIAAPIRGFGGLGVGAIGLSGSADRLFADRAPRPALVQSVVAAARAVTAQLEAPR